MRRRLQEVLGSSEDDGSLMLLKRAERMAQLTVELIDSGIITDLDYVGEPVLPRVSSAASCAVRAVIAVLLLEQTLSTDDDQGDASAERQRDRLGRLLGGAGQYPLERTVLDRVRELVADGGRVLGDVVLDAGVDDACVHESSPAVVARVLVTPGAVDATVGAPTDTLADAAVVAAGVSVDQGPRMIDPATLLPLVIDARTYFAAISEHLAVPEQVQAWATTMLAEIDAVIL